jgi:hypothetical protein
MPAIDAANRRLQGRRWVGSALFETVQRLNGQVLNFLLELSRSIDPPQQFMCLRDHPHLWSEMNADALVRAASCPVLLLDINFQSPEWCDASTSHILRAATPVAGAGPVFEQAKLLMDDILTEAWTAARALPRAASLAFGMTPTLTATIAAQRPADIHRLAIAVINEVRPRWDSHPTFWKHLLIAARRPDPRALTRIHLQCLQLLGSGFVPEGILPSSPGSNRVAK